LRWFDIVATRSSREGQVAGLRQRWIEVHEVGRQRPNNTPKNTSLNHEPPPSIPDWHVS
jgi:hypothetical protein